jgi:hypothetical protein
MISRRALLKGAAAAAALVGLSNPAVKAEEPEPWLEANGQAVSRKTYSELFSVFGTMYGEGDGATTFQLPDVPSSWRLERGRVVTRIATQSRPMIPAGSIYNFVEGVL